MIKKIYKQNISQICEICKTNKVYLYLTVLLVGILSFYGLCFFVNSNYFYSVIFFNPRVTFTDFFDCLKGYGGNPYAGEYGTNYPPLAVLVYKFFRRIVPQELFSMWSGEMRGYDLPIISFVLYNFIIGWIIFVCLNEKIKDVKLRNYLVLVLSLSAPAIYAIERGNIINLSFAFTLFFVCFYDSKNRFVKEIAFIALALAAGLKIYPAIFGFLLLKHGKKGECIRCAIYGIIIFFVPFSFFGGISAIFSFVRGLTGFVSSRTVISVPSVNESIVEVGKDVISMPPSYGYNFSYSNICSVLENICEINIPDVCLNVLLCVIVLVLLIGAYQFKAKWQEQLCLLLILILLPPVNFGYILIFTFIPFLEYCCAPSEQKNGDRQTEWIYLFFMAVLIIPWALPNVKCFAEQEEQLSGSFLLYFLTVISLTVMNIVEVSLLLVRNEKKQGYIRITSFVVTLIGSLVILYKSMV